VAALGVVLYHLCVSHNYGTLPLVGAFVGIGQVGVNLFFLLSGFVLSYSYLDATGRMRGPLQTYYVGRVARIYPAYLTALLISSPLLLRSAVPFPAVLATLGLVQAWCPAQSSVWDAPAWSLSVEAFFYLLFPFLGVLASRWRHLPRDLAVCWGLALLPAVLEMTLMHSASAAPWPDTPLQRAIHGLPIVRLPEFLCGVLLARLYVCRAGRPFPLALPPLALASIGFVALCPMLRPYPLLQNGLLDPAFAVLIYALAGRPSLLSSRIAVRLGEASYALFLIHWPVWETLSRLVVPPPAGSPAALAYGTAYVALALAVALSLCRYVETPARDAIRARWG
jgi:peptidoglycan/LPS O-acetylase OafA/YrhL